MNLLFMVVIECNYYYPLLLVVTRLVVSRQRALCGSIVSCHLLIFVTPCLFPGSPLFSLCCLLSAKNTVFNLFNS